MIELGVDSESRAMTAFAKEIYVDTEERILRVKICRIWLNADGSEFQRRYQSLIFTDASIHHYEPTGEVDENGDAVQEPVSQWAYWMNQQLEAGAAYAVLSALIESSLVSEGYLEVS